MRILKGSYASKNTFICIGTESKRLSIRWLNLCGSCDFRAVTGSAIGVALAVLFGSEGIQVERVWRATKRRTGSCITARHVDTGP